MLMADDSLLVVIDVQGSLAHLMCRKEALFENLRKIIQGVQALNIPILWTEQNPQGLGPTIHEVSSLLPHIQPIPKLTFSCCGNERFMEALRKLKRKQVLITGIETHICVYQTAIDLVDLGYEVYVIADAVSSRTDENKRIGLSRIKEGGVGVTSVETTLFELLKIAQGEHFKEILKIVKGS